MGSLIIGERCTLAVNVLGNSPALLVMIHNCYTPCQR